MFSAYLKVSFKRSRLYRCLHVSTRHFSTPFDKLRNSQGFSSYPTGMLRLHQTHVESLQACEEDRFFASVVTWKWMKQHPIKNHGGLVAVGVDADLFDKVAEKLATSGDLEKALDFGVLEYGWLQYFNAFRSLASTSPTGLRGAEGPLLLCPEWFAVKGLRKRAMTHGSRWIVIFQTCWNEKKLKTLVMAFFGAHDFSIELHELESSYIELHDTLAPSDWTLKFTIGQGGLWLPHQLFNLMGSQEMCVFQANNLLETMLQCLCSMLHSRWSIKNIWQCASHQKEIGVPGSAAETSDEMRSDRMK